MSIDSSLNQIEQLNSELQKLLPLKPEDQARLDKKFRLEFSYNSNHLEGNTLTYSETELLLIFDDTKGNHTLQEYQEMKAHDIAYQLIEEWAKDNERPLSEQFIKNLNEVLLVRPYWKDAITPDGQNTRRQIKVGSYKEHPNSVRLQNGEIFNYTSPAETPIQMQELIDWYREEEKRLHPVTLATMLHYKFVRIHPFDDGNGRISRLLMNYVLLKHNLPPIIIKSTDKANYLRVLHSADIGEYEPFIDYIAEQVIWSLNISIKAGKGESIEDADDIIKELTLLKKEVFINKTITKSPIAVLQVFNYTEKHILPAIEDKISSFNDLFKESKETHYLNRMEEKFEEYDTLLPFRLKVSSKPKEAKIFGYNIYENDIKTIEWKIVKYGLSNAKKTLNFDIKLNLLFQSDNYYTDISINGTKAFSILKPYNNVIEEQEITDINNNVAKLLLEKIKESING